MMAEIAHGTHLPTAMYFFAVMVTVYI